MPNDKSVVAWPSGESFDKQWSAAAAHLVATRPSSADDSARIALWRKQEWHNWFRWRLCRKGFDWSKPAVILLLALGFGVLVAYGFRTGAWYVTAGGVVAWFTVVNLSFFVYFGLTLPGPPLALPAPVKSGEMIRAEMGLYPSGYERRKLARVWLRIQADDGGPAHRFELTFAKLPDDIEKLLGAQTTWRMQRGDAPLTRAVVDTLAVSRAEIDAGAHSVKIVAWRWEEQGLAGFERGRG
ncbi:MAG TPA: hypothetical protein VKX17_13105 [Planctomycetota bacterium]|nr:hypothetical protein [Planctomycetota bacterium]